MGRKRKIIDGICTKCGSTNIRYRKVTLRDKLIDANYCIPCNSKSALESHKASKYKSVANYVRRKNTGFTPEEYEQKLIEQNYSCAICGTHQSELKKSLAADHNHTTKQKRGLLCTRCNLMLGYAQDDPSILSRAIVYLLEYE